MQGKCIRAWPKPALNPSSRLRNNLEDLFLSNQVSGERAESLMVDAQLARASNFTDWKPKAGKLGKSNTASRGLRRKLDRYSLWPKLYWAPITVYDVSSQSKNLCTTIPFANFDITVEAAAHHLANCDDALSVGLFDHALIAENARKFCQLYCSLNRSSPDNIQWRVKPKLHLFLEMTELSMTRPSLCGLIEMKTSEEQWH